MRIGTVTSWTVIGTQFATGNLTKHKKLSGTALWSGANYATGNLRKNKKLSGTAVHTSHNVATGNLLKNKKLSGAAEWHGAQYATGNLTKHKTLHGTAIYSGVNIVTGNLPKHKKLSGDAIWSGTPLATGNLVKSKLISGTAEWDGSSFAGSADTSSATGDNNWTNKDNIIGPPDGSYATWSSGSSPNTSFWLIGVAYGFAVPGGATIDGVQAVITRHGASGIAPISDTLVQLFLSSTPIGTNKAVGTNWPTSDTPQTYGGSSDLWGATLTPSDVNDISFGVGISVNNGTDTGAQAFVDSIAIKIFYH